jgi:hypothetical protein
MAVGVDEFPDLMSWEFELVVGGWVGLVCDVSGCCAVGDVTGG